MVADDLLDPAQAPAGLPAIRRLNKVPIFAIGGVLVVILAALGYAIASRSQATGEAGGAAGPAIPEPAGGAVQDARASYEQLVEEFQDAGEIPAAPDVGVVPQAPAMPAAAPPDPGAAELEKYRLDLLKDAAAASTGVAAGGRAEPPPASPPRAVPADPRADLLARALEATGEEGPPPEADENLRGRKAAFAAGERRFGYAAAARRQPAAEWELKVGTVIPAILIGGIDSDLPGIVLAQVSGPVFDTRTGEAVLIPRGARLVGAYDHYVALGQRRVMAAWHRVQFPDGSVLDLEEGLPGVDQEGYAGLSDQVERRLWEKFGTAGLLSVIGAGAQLSQARDGEEAAPTAGQVATEEFGRQWGELGRESARRNMRVQPTLRIRPGYRFNVMVTRDLILEPYRGRRR